MKAFFFNSRNVMLLGCVGSLLGHAFLVSNLGLNGFQTPISHLSQNGAWLAHGAVLTLFALAQASLVAHVEHPAAGMLTRCIQGLSLINAVLILSLTYAFTLPESALHTTLLSVIASFTGVSMACLIARDVSRNNLTDTIVHGVFLFIWLALIPLYLLIEAQSIGAYERTVAAVYCAWLITVATRRRIIQRT